MLKILSKNKIINYLLIILITGFYLFSFYKPYLVVGDDLPFHLNRIVGLSKAFEEGQILPKIYPYHNNGFGYALPLFYCDLFLYPFAILYHFGLSANVSYKLCIIFYTFISNIIIYRIINKETNNWVLSFMAILIYLGSNYHIQTILDRAGLSEVIAFTFIPLVLHSIFKILVKHENCFIYLAISFSLLLMSHLLTTFLYGIFFFCMIIVFIIINRKDGKLIKNTLLTILKGTLLACLLCAWYLVPMIEQFFSQRFWLSETNKDFDISVTSQSFTTLFKIIAIRKKQEFTLVHEASCGVVLFILYIVSLFIKKDRKIITVSVFCLIVYFILFGILPSKFLSVIQYLFRLYSLQFPLMCFIVIYGLKNINKKYLNIILSIICLVFAVNIYITNISMFDTSLYQLDDRTSEKDLAYITDNSQNGDYNYDQLGQAEYLPLAYNINYNTDSKSIKILDKYGNYVDYLFNYERSFTEIIFSVNLKEESELMIPLSYYKGYALYEYIDDKWIRQELSYSIDVKEITFTSLKGAHTYKVKYVGTLIQNMTLVISTLTWAILFISYLKKNKKIDTIK